MRHSLNWHFSHVREQQPTLQYHNYNHVFSVAAHVDRLCSVYGVTEQKHAVVLAALYHDIVYIPGNKDNEDKSAEYLLNIEPEMVLSSDLIKQTTINNHLSISPSFDENPLLCILLDADLSSLCKDFDSFVKQQEDILEENSLSKDYKYLSADFLDLLTVKGFLYRTPECKKILQDIAMENCRRFSNLYRRNKYAAN